MKTESEISFDGGCEDSHHRRRGQVAVRLELAGRYKPAARAWAWVAKQVLRADWRAYAEARAARCRQHATGQSCEGEPCQTNITR
ncbi:hypothetical protein [Cedecea sp. NFIX57]|uniref:hypothetical protein n=1 Tax=Cedecea sp. NFIX57 TaxID=1566286 RepID=UPI000A0AABC5|nr:hypothetical protein [Cedecea sp. NFIX57]SMG59915.1 hypothetical protein SAMN03159353_103243 [Cedecea sp. NFIX57]